MLFRSRSRVPSAASRRRRSLIQTTVGVVVAAVVVGALVDVLWIAHAPGPRVVTIDGVPVMSADGISIRSNVWLSEPEMQVLFERLGMSTTPLKGLNTRGYHGTPYVRATEVATLLKTRTAGTQFAANKLTLQLHANQHYTYTSAGGTVRLQQITVNGKAVAHVLGLQHDETAYVPASAVATALDGAGLHSAWTGQALQIAQTQAPSKAISGGIQNLAAVTPIQFGSGQAIAAPQFTWRGADYVPVNSVTAALRQLGWTGSMATWQWSVAAGSKGTTAAGNAVTTAQTPLTMAFVPFYSGNLSAYQDVMQHKSAFNAMAADAWEITGAGTLTGSAPAGTNSQALGSGEPVYATVANIGASGFNGQLMATILSSPSKSKSLQTAVVNLVNGQGDTGAVLDVESIPPGSRNAYTGFVASLAKQLHAIGKELWVVVPPDTGYSNESWNGAYDEAMLGQVANGIIVMAYDYSYAGGKPGPIAPLPWVQQVLAYAVSQVPANRVLLGVDVYGYDWGNQGGVAVSLPSVDSFIAAHHIKPQWDARDEAPWYTWTDSSGVTHTVYYENKQSTNAKLALATMYGIRGIAIWRAGLENAPVLSALQAYAHKQ